MEPSGPVGAVLAHPLTHPFHLPVSPLVAGGATAIVVLVLAYALPEGERRLAEEPERESASWSGSLSVSQLAGRVAAVALLVLAIAAGRLGSDDELENLAPALVVGAGWPLLVAASAIFGPVWRWTDPWDGVARALVPRRLDGEPDNVWPAVLVALAWVWYLSAYRDTLDPRSVGTMLALYTLLTVGGCLAVGRTRWLPRCEPLGIVVSWMALLPRGRLADWNPPRGAEWLLGTLAGGVLFGAMRSSELWGDLNTARHADLLAALGVVASAAAVGLLLAGVAVLSRAGPALTRAAVPALAGIIVAVAMDRNRLTTSVQLLPGLLGDPFGRGWDLFGEAGAGLDPAPLGASGLLWAQLAIVFAGYAAGAAVLARRVRRRARNAAAIGLSVLAAASVIAVVSH